jgi:hypothetical protein
MGGIPLRPSRNVDHPGFGASNSIKAVGPVLAPELNYDDLAGVAEGGSAAAALYRLATGNLQPGEREARLRQDLLHYCSRDTEVLASTWNALLGLANDLGSAKQVGLVADRRRRPHRWWSRRNKYRRPCCD